MFGRAFLVYTGEHSTSISYCEMGGHWLFCFWLNCAILFSAPIQPWCHESIAAEKVCKLYCMRVVVLLKRLWTRSEGLFSSVMYAEHVLLAVLSPFPTLPSTFNCRIRNWSCVCWVGIIRDKLGYSKNSEAYIYFGGGTLELTNACFACVRLIWRNCKTFQIVFKQQFFF